MLDASVIDPDDLVRRRFAIFFPFWKRAFVEAQVLVVGVRPAESEWPVVVEAGVVRSNDGEIVSTGPGIDRSLDQEEVPIRDAD
jgi:hypothetical protein